MKGHVTTMAMRTLPHPTPWLTLSPEHAVVVHDQLLVNVGGGVAAGEGVGCGREVGATWTRHSMKEVHVEDD
jgi:hypothetical protein